MRFTALLHHVYDVEHLRAAYYALKRDAAPGIDGETWEHYGEALEANLADLSGRLKRGAYRAKPVKRAYIPKADGRQRPLGIPTLEDKLVQRTTVEVLNAIYETDFLGFSYGFRPGRSPHHALDALYAGLLTRKVNWVLDADIRGFFDAIDHGWLVKFIEHRIADRRVVRLIQKWLNAGVLEDGTRTWSEDGHAPGGQHFAAPGQRVPALRVRPLGSTVAEDASPRRHDRRAVRGRLHRGVSAPGGGRAVPGGAARAVREVRPGAAPREDARCWSSGPSRPSTGGAPGRGSRRRSTSSASRTSAGRSGMGGSRWCGRRSGRGCRRS